MTGSLLAARARPDVYLDHRDRATGTGVSRAEKRPRFGDALMITEDQALAHRQKAAPRKDRRKRRTRFNSELS